MELKFKPYRLKIIMRLRDMSQTQIEEKMRVMSGSKKRMNVDRWWKNYNKHDFKKVELLARATDVPVGYYFFDNVVISMDNLIVKILVVDTNQSKQFHF